MASRAPVGECAAAHAALGRVTARHRQLALLLGSAADCAQLREELQERGKEAQELGTGKGPPGPGGWYPIPRWVQRRQGWSRGRRAQHRTIPPTPT